MTPRRSAIAHPAGSTPAADSFARVAADYLRLPGVTSGTGFGTNPGPRLDGRIFAMTIRGTLVVKLPAERIATLVATGTGQPFETAPGRRMREWLSVPTDREAAWPGLVAEAFELASASREDGSRG
jgi:hypothetical protein